MTAATSWQHDVYGVLRAHDVTQFSYVPDAGHMILIDLSIADPDVHAIALTTEEEGVVLAAGANLGDARSNVCSYLKSGRTSGCPRTAASCQKLPFDNSPSKSENASKHKCEWPSRDARYAPKTCRSQRRDF